MDEAHTYTRKLPTASKIGRLRVQVMGRCQFKTFRVNAAYSGRVPSEGSSYSVGEKDSSDKMLRSGLTKGNTSQSWDGKAQEWKLRINVVDDILCARWKSRGKRA